MIASDGSQGRASALSMLSTNSTVCSSASANSVGITICSYQTAPRCARRGDRLAGLPAAEVVQHPILEVHQLLGPRRPSLGHRQYPVGMREVAVVG